MPKEFDYYRINEGETDYKLRKGGGLRDWIKNKTAARPGDDRFGQLFFRTIIASGPLTKFAPTDAVIKSVAMLGGTSNTKGVSMPLWVENERPKFGPGNPAQGTSRAEEDRQPKSKHIEINKRVFSDIHPAKPPMEMLRETVERAGYRAIMHECLCRKIQGCQDYPLDLGCLFIGPAARACVDRGIAYEATLEQCLDHLDRAKEAGLSASAYFVEVEEYVWGFHDEDMPNFLEICFCCPCCCSAVKFEQRAGGELKRILHQGSGWRCVVDYERCVGCGACVSECPHERSHMQGDHPMIHYECAGCGQCLKVCPTGALSVQHIGVTKPRVEDYFEKLHQEL